MPLPEANTHQDRLLTLNINEADVIPRGGQPAQDGVTLTPLFLDRENGVWALYGRFAPGTVLPTHYHTGVVHFFTTRGQWNYLEYPNDPQTAGSYLFEPGGSIHTLSVPEDATEPAEGFFVVFGSNVNFLDGEYVGMTDAGSIEEDILASVRAGQYPMPKYIRPSGSSIVSSATAVHDDNASA